MRRMIMDTISPRSRKKPAEMAKLSNTVGTIFSLVGEDCKRHQAQALWAPEPTKPTNQRSPAVTPIGLPLPLANDRG